MFVVGGHLARRETVSLHIWWQQQVAVDLASLSGRTKPITAHENENCDWFVVLLIPRPCNFKNVVFISRTYILLVRCSGELEEMLAPLLLILQLHFHL